MSGEEYFQAQYIASYASDEVINELDNGQRTIAATYRELLEKGGNY